MALLDALWAGGPDQADLISVSGETTSRDGLAERAAATAGRLRGARSVAVHGSASVDTVVAVVAALTAGVSVVPLAADVGQSERDHILRDSKVEAALGAWPWSDTGLEVIPLADAAERTTGTLPQAPAPEAVALVMYTSGTTGPPKGVVLSHRALAADLDGLAEAWEWTPEDHLVHGLPLFHVHGLVLGVLGALRVGSRLTHTGRPSPDAYAAAGGSLYFGVPTVWSRVCAEPAAARALRPARLLVSGSAALPAATFSALEELTGHVPVERYGTTETLITLSARANGKRRPGRVGSPISGVEVRLRDDTGALVDAETTGVTGEIEVSGPTLFDGYLGMDATVGRTTDGWFRTGDAAFVDEDGALAIVGRMATDLIKSGGYRIGAGEIEDALLAHPAVQEAAVVGEDDADLGQCIVAYVVARGVTDAELVSWVGDRLSRHKRPRRVHFVDALPRNAMGKVQKARLGPSLLRPGDPT